MSQTKAQLLNPLGDLDLTGQLTGVGATFTGNITAVDGIFSGNVSVAGTLTKEDVTNVDSVGVVTARQGVVVPDGEGYKFGDGSYRIEGKDDGANARIGFVAGGTERVRIDSNGDINLGNNPTNQYGYKLNIQDSSILYAQTASSGGTELKLHLDNSTGLATFGTVSSDNLALVTNNLERLRIQSDGKIGIGTNSASALLHIEGTQTGLQIERNTQTLKIDANYGNGGDQSLTASAALRIYTGGANERLRITSTGNVGINDSSPDTRLSVNSGTTDVVAKFTSSDANAWIQFRDNSTTDTGVMVGANGDDLLLRAGSNERIRIASAGQIGIAGANYGNAGQVLTSGGSGSAISWADAAGGAEFAGIASGSMSAGDPVILHSDGKLSKVGYQWAADLSPNPAGDSNLVQPSSSAMQDYSLAFWSRNNDGTFPSGTANPMVSFFYKNSSSGPSWRSSEVTSGTTNMAHIQSSGFNQGDGIGEFDGKWNPVATAAGGGGRLLLAFNRTSGHSGKPAVQVMRGPYSNGVWTQGGIYDINNTAAQGGISVGWHDANRWVVVYGQGGNYYGNVVTLTGSTSVSLGSGTTIETGLTQMSYRGSMTDADNNGKHIVFYAGKTTGNRNSWRYSVVTVSGTSVSFSTPNWLGDDANPGLAIGDMRPEVSFDPDQNRFLVVYYKQTATNGGGGINKIFARNAVISGTSVTWSAETQISAQNARGYDTAFDTNLKKHIVYLQDQSTTKVVYHLVNFTGSAAPSTNSEADAYSGSKELLNLGIDYDATFGMVIVGGKKGNDGNNLAEFVQRTALSSSNLGDNNFVGFSKGSYTDGNTAKIGSLSALDENQTGLTTATTYYVKDDGTLSITPSTPIVEAGKAVSSTNLIVKDATPRPGSLGHWTYYLQDCGVFKSWCACGFASNQGGIIGAYECANSSCRYCAGRWNPFCCVQGQEHFNYDIPTVGGGNMCLGCGGCSCDSAYNFERACCCCWPTGRFWFPEVGIYCYNFNIILSACLGAPAANGCWSTVSYYTVPKNRNRTCCNVFCGINGYNAYSTNLTSNCSPQRTFENIHMDGIVGVADTTKNFMAFGLSKASSTSCVITQNGLQLKYDGCVGRYPNTVQFEKISNDPRITYCN